MARRQPSVGIPKWAFNSLAKETKQEVVARALSFKEDKKAAENVAVVAEAESKSKLLKALPWVAIGAVVIIAVVIAKKRRSR